MAYAIEQLSLQRYAEKDKEALAAFRLPAEQAQYTALPLEVLEPDEGKHPIVIVSGKGPVGFFVLHTSERVRDYTENLNALLLTALSINHVEQGKGYAKKAMLLLKDFVRSQFPAYDEVVLAVNHKNIPAQRLYEKAGFRDTGRRREGNLGEQYIYAMKVNECSPNKF
ncbi:GNAT family protein [Paenibacillus sp. VCA1]|uniref:GNAT family N-acetyltransferase n=1 Tax=Paenibacillus sp. VCA1 TaxID=3039148 RepID=UPI0028725A8C|nr:GNAT family protein [Paenibacillus sp. VCA1]MDR9857021.1 GNAT family protein [Paenibacillus sp. VCA1]